MTCQHRIFEISSRAISTPRLIAQTTELGIVSLNSLWPRSAVALDLKFSWLSQTCFTSRRVGRARLPRSGYRADELFAQTFQKQLSRLSEAAILASSAWTSRG